MRLRAVMDWLGALLVTAAVSVTLLGVAESMEKTDGVPATADGFTVVVDAGHGGADGGAIGSETGVVEAELNLAVAKRVEAGLAANGVNVVMTRADSNALDDTKRKDMAARRRILRGEGVDLIVSIHMNQFQDRSIHGAMTYYMKGSAEGEKAAAKLIESICSATGQKRRLPNPGDYFVLRECTATAVLVECGFLSNPEECAKLQSDDYQNNICFAILAGLLRHREGAGNS